MNIRQLVAGAVRELAGQPTARLDAEILLGHALAVKRSFLYANRDLEVPLKCRAEFLRLVQCRRLGTPIAYLTGHRPFWTLDLRVTPAVLIPRPETELLVETALLHIPVGAARRVVDLGTGSGAIALALARERPQCEVHAVDCSLDALQVAQDNAHRHQLERVRFHHGSWAEPLRGQFDVVVSNPPYVAQGDSHLQQGDCRFEPQLALVSGVDGLSAIRQIAAAARGIMVEGGWLLLEHGYDQGEGTRSILHSNGYVEIETVSDLAGIERVCCGRTPKTKTDRHPASLLV